MEELVRLSEKGSRTEIEKGRVLLAAGEQPLREEGVPQVTPLHRCGGVVETILEREDEAQVIAIGQRGGRSRIRFRRNGSVIERAVRASSKPVLVAFRHYADPWRVVVAYGASPAADRALKPLTNAPLFDTLPVTIVMAEAEEEARLVQLANV